MIKEDFPTPPFFRNLISVDKYDKLIDVRQAKNVFKTSFDRVLKPH